MYKISLIENGTKQNEITIADIVDKEMFDKMNTQIFEFEEDAGEIVSDIYYCELLKMYADCATLIFSDNTVYHVDIHLAICIYNGEFEQISLDN